MSIRTEYDARTGIAFEFDDFGFSGGGGGGNKLFTMLREGAAKGKAMSSDAKRKTTADPWEYDDSGTLRWLTLPDGTTIWQALKVSPGKYEGETVSEWKELSTTKEPKGSTAQGSWSLQRNEQTGAAYRINSLSGAMVRVPEMDTRPDSKRTKQTIRIGGIPHDVIMDDEGNIVQDFGAYEEGSQITQIPDPKTGKMHYVRMDARGNTLQDYGAAKGRNTLTTIRGNQVLIDEDGNIVKTLGPAEDEGPAPLQRNAATGQTFAMDWNPQTKRYEPHLINELSGKDTSADDRQERLTREGWQRDDQRFQWQMQRDEQRLAEEAKQRERDRLLRMRELEYQNRFADVHGSRRESIDNLYGHLAGGSGVGASDNPFYGLFGMNAIREFQGQKDTMATAAQNVLGRQAAQAMGPAQADEQKRLQWEAEQKRWEQEASRPRAPLSAFGGPFGGGQNFRPSPFVDSGRAPARPQLPGGFWDPRRLPQLPGLAHGGMVVGNGEPVTISAGGEPMAVAGEAGPEMLNFPRQDMATVTPMGPSQQQMDMMGAALFIKNLLGASRAQKGRPFR